MLMLMRRLGGDRALSSPSLLPPPLLPPPPLDPSDARELERTPPTPLPEANDPLLRDRLAPFGLSSHSGLSSLWSSLLEWLEAHSASSVFSWNSCSSDSFAGSCVQASKRVYFFPGFGRGWWKALRGGGRGGRVI